MKIFSCINCHEHRKSKWMMSIKMFRVIYMKARSVINAIQMVPINYENFIFNFFIFEMSFSQSYEVVEKKER